MLSVHLHHYRSPYLDIRVAVLWKLDWPRALKFAKLPRPAMSPASQSPDPEENEGWKSESIDHDWDEKGEQELEFIYKW
jgi:hypothetical protein